MLGGATSSNRPPPPVPLPGHRRSRNGERDARRPGAVIWRAVLVGAARDEHAPVGEDGRRRRHARGPEEADLRPAPCRCRGVVHIRARVGLPAVHVVRVEAACHEDASISKRHGGEVPAGSGQRRGLPPRCGRRVPALRHGAFEAEDEGSSVAQGYRRPDRPRERRQGARRDPRASRCGRRTARRARRDGCGRGRGLRRSGRRHDTGGRGHHAGRGRRRRGRSCRRRGRFRRPRHGARRWRHGCRPACGSDHAHDDSERTERAEAAPVVHPNTSGHRLPAIEPATNDAAFATTATAMARRGSRPRNATA